MKNKKQTRAEKPTKSRKPSRRCAVASGSVSGFKRELRYIVIKITDANRCLSEWQKRELAALCSLVSQSRKAVNKRPLKCVVVESDWPEYQPTWRAIKKRMSSQNIRHEPRPTE